MYGIICKINYKLKQTNSIIFYNINSKEMKSKKQILIKNDPNTNGNEMMKG